MMSELIRHLEVHLGTIALGWGDKSSIQVAQFPDRPERGITTYSTLGLSSVVLPMPGKRGVRQEFIVSVGSSFDAERVASFLGTFAAYVKAQNRALLRGDVVGPSVPLIDGVRACAVYASNPVFFDDAFAAFGGSDPATVFVWLMPLPREDVELIRAVGWSSFEDILESADVDFWDLNRPPIRRDR